IRLASRQLYSGGAVLVVPLRQSGRAAQGNQGIASGPYSNSRDNRSAAASVVAFGDPAASRGGLASPVAKPRLRSTSDKFGDGRQADAPPSYRTRGGQETGPSQHRKQGKEKFLHARRTR